MISIEQMKEELIEHRVHTMSVDEMMRLATLQIRENLNRRSRYFIVDRYNDMTGERNDEAQ